jgi:pimeloyl-ACP methyl ester carboxylesterase
MPFARARDGTRLYYEAAGGRPGGAAVLLVMGLGLRGAIWGETRDALVAAGYCTVTMDNRGVGESQILTGGFTTETMADDAIAVLDDAGVGRAHVVGTSLGGMIAQRLALGHAPRVAALVLQSTTAGMPRLDFVPITGLVGAAGMVRARVGDHSAEERERAILRLATTRRYARSAVLSDPRLRLYLDAIAAGVSPVGYAGQIRAAWRHRLWQALPLIRAPTLVQHGAHDQVVRAAAGRAIARRIPGAQLEIYGGAGHFLALQRPDSLGALVRFLVARDAQAERAA